MTAWRHRAARETWLTLSALKWSGLKFLDRLVMLTDEPDVLVRGDAAALARIEDLQPEGRERLLAARARLDLRSHLAGIERAGLAVTTPADPAWPERLRDLVDAPFALYHRGPLPGPRDAVVGIVGTRAATAYGAAVARQMARELARAGVLVISGLAQGIDGAAHQGALEAPGGRTLAVLASDAHTCYPPGHHALYRRIVERGTVLSEAPPGVHLARWLFPLRNRIVSGLCHVLVVVEAPHGSGALITARHAADQAREVLVVPGPVTSPASAGSHALLRDGARLVTGAAEVLEELGTTYQPPLAASDGFEAHGDVRVVLDLLRGDALETDQLLEQSGLRPGRLYRLLLDLTAAGVVSRLAGNRWARLNVPMYPARLGEGVTPTDGSDPYMFQSGEGPADGAIACDGDARWICP